VLLQKAIQKRVRTMEVRTPQPLHRLREVYEIVPSRGIENADCAGDSEPSCSSRSHAGAVVHKNRVSLQGPGQFNRGPFTVVQ